MWIPRNSKKSSVSIANVVSSSILMCWIISHFMRFVLSLQDFELFLFHILKCKRNIPKQQDISSRFTWHFRVDSFFHSLLDVFIERQNLWVFRREIIRNDKKEGTCSTHLVASTPNEKEFLVSRSDSRNLNNTHFSVININSAVCCRRRSTPWGWDFMFTAIFAVHNFFCSPAKFTATQIKWFNIFDEVAVCMHRWRNTGNNLRFIQFD